MVSPTPPSLEWPYASEPLLIPGSTPKYFAIGSTGYSFMDFSLSRAASDLVLEGCF